jgi:hypothetical protein
LEIEFFSGSVFKISLFYLNATGGGGNLDFKVRTSLLGGPGYFFLAAEIEICLGAVILNFHFFNRHFRQDWRVGRQVPRLQASGQEKWIETGCL